MLCAICKKEVNLTSESKGVLTQWGSAYCYDCFYLGNDAFFPYGDEASLKDKRVNRVITSVYDYKERIAEIEKWENKNYPIDYLRHFLGMPLNKFIKIMHEIPVEASEKRHISIHNHRANYLYSKDTLIKVLTHLGNRKRRVGKDGFLVPREKDKKLRDSFTYQP